MTASRLKSVGRAEFDFFKFMICPLSSFNRGATFLIITVTSYVPCYITLLVYIAKRKLRNLMKENAAKMSNLRWTTIVHYLTMIKNFRFVSSHEMLVWKIIPLLFSSIIVGGSGEIWLL